MPPRAQAASKTMKLVVCLNNPRQPLDSTVKTEWNRHPFSPWLLIVSSSRCRSLFEKLAPMLMIE